jgi:hypothetical protein
MTQTKPKQNKEIEIKKMEIGELIELKRKIEDEIERKTRLSWTKLLTLWTAIDFLAEGKRPTPKKLEKEYKQRLKELKECYLYNTQSK